MAKKAKKTTLTFEEKVAQLVELGARNPAHAMSMALKVNSKRESLRERFGVDTLEDGSEFTFSGYPMKVGFSTDKKGKEKFDVVTVTGTSDKGSLEKSNKTPKLPDLEVASGALIDNAMKLAGQVAAGLRMGHEVAG